MKQRIEELPPLGKLNVPLYVIRMGWHRWSLSAQLRWLHNLRDTCREVADDCDQMIARYERERP